MINRSKIGEECGVFAIYDPRGGCAQSTYYGLYALQHRGQESCGIAVNCNRDIHHYKDMGLVNEVFNQDIIDKLKGTMAVGHVRYSTTGESLRENAQPLVLRYVKGNIALAHNGNLVNKDELTEELSKTGAIFQTTTDTETIAYMIAKERLTAGSIEKAVANTMEKLIGAFSLIVMSPRKLIAARDPWGFRPLCMGRKDEAIVFASETCALDSIGAKFVRDIDPGEIVVVENGNVFTIDDYKNTKKSSMCIFEYIYFARPDSTIQGQTAHDSRVLAGRFLAQEYPVEADVVIGVPDSGISAAQGYAMESGIPYGLGFIKNKYIGRTFIQPSQSMRENAVRIKLNVLKSTVCGKRVVMVDDSIVRGTTSKRIVNLLREAGAKEVHVRSSAPPFMWPCYFGTDVPSRDQLVACNHTMDEIRNLLNADSLGFLSIEALHKIAPNANCGFCDACFSGNYPVDVSRRSPSGDVCSGIETD
ncbi:MAG: amidophosphoribosyltransferase [Clostridia bacterium]|nr:amidophosphoribosyltransferase [Clostridia bacterium]